MQKLPITGETESANDCRCNREGGRERARERYATVKREREGEREGALSPMARAGIRKGERSERGEREG
jgi:hypothetical protein